VLAAQHCLQRRASPPPCRFDVVAIDADRREWLRAAFGAGSACGTGRSATVSYHAVPMLEQRIQQQFFDSADLKYAAAEILAKPLADAVAAVVGCITAGGKVLACGNGGSASDAQHFAAEFVGRFERERPGLAAIALTTDTSILTAIGNDYDFASIYAKQVQALGVPGDVLLAITTSGNSANILAAVETAHAKDLTVIALTGKGGGKLGAMLTETDVHVCVPHDRTARIQEVHILALHCICDAVDLQLLGEQENT
jgi:D-sedoheptulose 7-phosphate isomerase